MVRIFLFGFMSIFTTTFLGGCRYSEADSPSVYLDVLIPSDGYERDISPSDAGPILPQEPEDPSL